MIGPGMDRHRAAVLFGKILLKHRLQAGLSQEAVADAASLHRTYIGMIESGRRLPTVLSAWQLARSLEVPFSDLMAEVEAAYRRSDR